MLLTETGEFYFSRGPNFDFNEQFLDAFKARPRKLQ